jgi:predicted helicase
VDHDAAVSTLEDILDQLYFSATDERDKGDKFERLMLQFFKTDLQWSERFAGVAVDGLAAPGGPP